MVTPPRLRAAIYLRISEDREGSAAGVQRQQEDCADLTERLGWQVAEIYCDNDVSAYSGKTRVGYRKMLADIEAGAIDAIVSWHNDRLHRTPLELEQFITIIEEHGVEIQTVRAGRLDLSTPSGRMSARNHGNYARYESEHKSDRIRRKHEEIAKNGRVSGGGSRAYGYDSTKMRVVAEEAAIIQSIAVRLLSGEALAGVAKDLNREGILTTNGKQWSVQTLKRMMVSARIAGQREHRPRPRTATKRALIGEIVADAVWPAIITPEQSARLRILLMDPSRRVSPGRNGRYPLTGLLYCGRCEGKYKLVGRPRDDGARRYVCDGNPGRPGCGKCTALADTLENYLYNMVSLMVDDPEFMHRLRTAGDEGSSAFWLAEITRDETELEELARDLGERRVTRKEWLAAREPIEKRLRVNRARMVRTDHRAGLALADAPTTGEQAGVWLRDVEVALAKRQLFLAAMVNRVVVNPAVKGRNFFDQDRFEVVWRA